MSTHDRVSDLQDDAGSRGAVQSSSLTLDHEIAFINQEIDRYVELWKDNDVLGPAAPFVTGSAVLVPAAVLISQTVSDTRLFYLACIPLLLFVATLALYLAFRFMRAVMLGRTYLIHTDVLRTYFIDRAPDMADYVPRQVRSNDFDYAVRHLGTRTAPGILVFPTITMSAGLVGPAGALTMWWANEDGATWLFITVGAATGVLSLAGETALIRWHRGTIARQIAHRF